LSAIEMPSQVTEAQHLKTIALNPDVGYLVVVVFLG